jgi:hypothetical protein
MRSNDMVVVELIHDPQHRRIGKRRLVDAGCPHQALTDARPASRISCESARSSIARARTIAPTNVAYVLMAFASRRFRFARNQLGQKIANGTHIVGDGAPHGRTLSRHVRPQRGQHTTRARIVAVCAGQIERGDRGEPIP